MKKESLLLILLFIFLVSCGAKAGPPASDQVSTVVEKQSVKDQVEALTPEDPRKQQIMALTWQIQYYREQIKTIEMAHMIQCYQSKEYRNTLAKIEQLNKQIRAMLLL